MFLRVKRRFSWVTVRIPGSPCVQATLQPHHDLHPPPASVSGISAQALRGNGKVSRQEWGGVYRHCASSSGALFARLARTLRRSACGFSPECLAFGNALRHCTRLPTGTRRPLQSMANGDKRTPLPPSLVEPKPEGRASRVRGEAAAASAGVQDSRCLYTHPPPWRRSSNACTAGKSKAFQSHRTGGVAILALGRRPRTRKAWSELISPISPAYPAASRTPCCSGACGSHSGVTTRSTSTRVWRAFRTYVRARPIRPSAKRQTWLPPGPWSTPGSSPPTTKRHHQPNRFCSSSCSSFRSSFCRSDKLWVEHRSIRPSAKLPPGPWSTPRVVSTDY